MLCYQVVPQGPVPGKLGIDLWVIAPGAQTIPRVPVSKSYSHLLIAVYLGWVLFL